MKLSTLLLLTVLILLCSFPASSFGNEAQLQNQITWYRADFPPVTIPRGKHVDQGFFDKTMYFIIKQLPEYNHQFQIANFNRIILELKKNKKICCPSLYKTPEREKFIAYSLPAMVVLPNGLITSEKSYPKLAAHLDVNGKISLLSLLQDNNVTMGISNGRIYSGGIDHILNQFTGQDNLLIRSGDDVFGGLISMLKMERIDCLLGYPAEAGYFVGENTKKINFIYYQIQESQVPFTVGYIGCPNNAWGNDIIRQIDEIVMQHRDKEFVGFYGEWLDEATKQTHKHLAEDFYNSQSSK